MDDKFYFAMNLFLFFKTIMTEKIECINPVYNIESFELDWIVKCIFITTQSTFADLCCLEVLYYVIVCTSIVGFSEICDLDTDNCIDNVSHVKQWLLKKNEENQTDISCIVFHWETLVQSLLLVDVK